MALVAKSKRVQSIEYREIEIQTSAKLTSTPTATHDESQSWNYQEMSITNKIKLTEGPHEYFLFHPSIKTNNIVKKEQ